MEYDPNDAHIGEHETHFEEPDIIVLKLGPTCNWEEGVEINRRHALWGQGRERVFFLIDLSKLESIHPEVRKLATSTMAKIPLRGMVSYGASLKAKVIATLIFTALNLFAKKAEKIPLVFTDGQAEARAWIAARRELLEQQDKASAGETAHGH